MFNRLNAVSIKGFKTIRDLSAFEPHLLTALIGPNGAGKSNLISFFRMLSWMLADPNNLQEYVSLSGGASALLRDGLATTEMIEAELTVVTDAGANQYAFRLKHAAQDTLYFTEERYRFSRVGFPEPAQWIELETGYRGPKLIEAADEDDTARVILHLLRQIKAHQFHNTSQTARVRNKWDVEDRRWLREDAANLAPFLFSLMEHNPKYYRRIVDTVRLILPFFSHFVFEPEYGMLLLRWREQGSDITFNASQASDGMLRIVALVALLLQPEDGLPDVLILDEPELGLHPYAINIVGGLIRGAAAHTQVIVATQSTSLVDCFEPNDIVVVERAERESTFKRLDAHELDQWLQEYSLSELWEMNVVGGRP